MVDMLMRIAPTAGDRVTPAQASTPAASGIDDHVVAGGPHEVLNHLAVARPREPDDTRHRPRIRRGQHDAGRLDRHVGAGADRQADVGAGERGRVVDTVTDHGDRQATLLQRGDRRVLVLWKHLGEDLVDADVGGDTLGDLAGVAGDHHDQLDAEGVELGDGLAGLGTDLVFQRQRADDPVAFDEVQHGCAASHPLRCAARDLRRLGQPALAHQRRSADRVARSVDVGLRRRGR